MAGIWSIIAPQRTEYTNLVANPSFELNTTGWSAVGGSISAVVGSGTKGDKGLAVVATAGNNDGVYFSSVSTVDLETYRFSLDFKGVAGQSYKIYFADGAGTLLGSATTFIATGYWERQTVTYNEVSVASRRLYIIKSNWAGAGDFKIDAVLVIKASVNLTYFDGDTPNCYWNGIAHASTSVVDAQARNVGIVTDLQDYNLRVLQMDGVGMVEASHHVSQYALMPGAEYQGHKVQPRYITLTSASYGTSLENLHSKLQDVIDLFKHDLVAGDQPVILRYTGANSNRPIEITCYVDKIIGKFDQQKVQRNAIQLICYDPYFYDIYNTAQSLTTGDSGTRRYFTCKRKGAWTAITPSAVTDPGAGIKVRDIAIKGSYLSGTARGGGGTSPERVYVSGYYLNWNGTAASDYICYFDFYTSLWTAVETGTNGYVRSMAFAPNGYLYACGEFTQIGGTAAERIAYWDGSAWNAMGTGFGGTAYDVLVGIDGYVYAVGNDTTIGGVAGAAYVAYWDGAAWQKMDAGLNAVAYVVDTDNAGNIYVGGTQTGYVSKWDGTSWTSLGAPATCWALKVAPNGTIYAGMSGGGYITTWNGQSWSSLGGGGGAFSFVYGLDIDADGILWVGGDFTTVGGLTVRGLACWNGYSWTHPDIQLPANSIVYTVRCNGNDIYLGYDTSGTTYFSKQNYYITNNGTARNYPVIAITRSGGTTASLRYIRNETTGATLYFNYSLQDGETLYIDFRETKRSIVSSFYGDVWRAMLRGSQFTDFFLIPSTGATGSNLISVFSYTTGAPTMTCNISNITRHESIDGAAV